MANDACAVWAKRVARWSDSGLSAKEFASETGLNANTLSLPDGVRLLFPPDFDAGHLRRVVACRRAHGTRSGSQAGHAQCPDPP